MISMNGLVRTFMLAALLNARAAVAQTVAVPAAPVVKSEQTVGMAESRFAAPIGHRQPRVQDIDSRETAIIERIDQENATLDRRLNICRGC